MKPHIHARAEHFANDLHDVYLYCEENFNGNFQYFGWETRKNLRFTRIVNITTNNKMYCFR